MDRLTNWTDKLAKVLNSQPGSEPNSLNIRELGGPLLAKVAGTVYLLTPVLLYIYEA